VVRVGVDLANHVLHKGSELVLGAGKAYHFLWDCQRSDACNVVLDVEFRSSE